MRQAAPPQQGAQANEQPAKSEGDDHDQIGAEEDGVAYSRDDPAAEVILRKDGVEAEVLQHPVEGDRQTGKQNDGDEPFKLSGGAEVQDYQEKEDGVAKSVVGTVHSNVCPPKAEMGGHRGYRGEDVRKDKEERGQDEGPGEQLPQQPSDGALAVDSIHQPGGQEKQDGEAKKGQP